MMSFAQSATGKTVLGSRLLRHACFWIAYYVLFSLVWASPARSYYVSFYLEFVLMPLRILASYCMMYVLIPAFLGDRKLLNFVASYALLIMTAGGLQMLIGHYFYDQLLAGRGEAFAFSTASWVRNIVLINSTVILLGAVKVFQLHFQLLDSLTLAEAPSSELDARVDDQVIEVKSNRKIHRLRIGDIMYAEGMGNYIRYVMNDGSRIVVYSSLKAAQAGLPRSFIRLHRSYLVNKDHISAYDKDSVNIADKTLPRAKDISDDMLRKASSERN